MKRRREIMEEKAKTEIRSAIEELSVLVKLHHKKQQQQTTSICSSTVVAVAESEQEVVVSHVPTRPFISLCTLILQVLDKIGPTMAVLRQDVYKNIQRLEMAYESNPGTNSNLVEIIKKEAVERNAKKGDSCSKALVWLTRALDFTATLLQKLASDPKESMEHIVGESYEMTLKPWHGWIPAAACKVALKLVPDTDTFINLLMDRGDQSLDTLKEEIQALVSFLLPLLQDIHSLLRLYGLDKLKST